MKSTRTESGNHHPGLVFMLSLYLLTAGLIILSSGCSKPYYLPTGPPPGSDTLVSFSSQVQPIFTNNCAVNGCHYGPQPQDGLTLTAGSAYSQIVNVPCIDVPGYLLIKPFFADSSFLYLKITGNPAAGVRMPYQRTPLSDTLINTIGRWINQGALNN